MSISIEEISSHKEELLAPAYTAQQVALICSLPPGKTRTLLERGDHQFHLLVHARAAEYLRNVPVGFTDELFAAARLPIKHASVADQL